MGPTCGANEAEGRRVKVVSLFSGAGGLDLGLVQAGNTVVWANDVDASAAETYRKNLGDHIVCKDIKDVAMSEIPDGADVVVGGFPCQGFSQANLRREVNDSRNALYLFFRKVVAAKKPRYFIAENVKGILSLGRGAVIRQIVSDFADVGYRVEYRLVDMADYGIPQHRRRVIIVGQREDVADEMLFRFPEPTCGKGLRPFVSIREALAHFPDPDVPNDVPNHVYSAYRVAFRDFTGHRPTDPDKPCPTILARGNGGGGVCAIPHYNGKRRLTIRESAAIQTFPDDFVFCGRMNACYRQIGNAVPVAFGRLLGKELRRLEGGRT